MPIVEQDWVDRVLVFFDPEGNIKGAEQHRLKQMVNTDSGTIYPIGFQPAEPLDPAQLQAVLPNEAAMLAQLSTILGNLSHLEVRYGALEEENKELKAYRDQFSKLEDEIAVLRHQIKILSAPGG